ASGEEASRIGREHPNAVIARLKPPGDQGPPGILYEALASETFCRTLVKGVAGRRRFKGRAGLVQMSATPSSRHLGRGKSEFAPRRTSCGTRGFRCPRPPEGRWLSWTASFPAWPRKRSVPTSPR